MHIVKQNRSGFTLIELLLVIANIGVLAGIVIMAINPSDQIIAATNAKRQANARELKNAITQYVIDYGEYPGDVEYSQNGSNATSICRQGATGADCVNLDILVERDYLLSIPFDDAVGNSTDSGYEVYINGPQALVQPGYIGQTPGVALDCSPTNPQLVKEIADDEGPFTKLGTVKDVTMIGDYAYVPAEYPPGYLTIIDVQDSNNPTLVQEITGNTGGFDEISGARQVKEYGGYVYIVASSDDAISVVDISDPDNPAVVNAIHDGIPGFEVLSTARAIDFQGNYMYVGTGYSNGTLAIFDISDPLNISLVGSVSNGTNGFTKLRSYGGDVKVKGDYVYYTSDYSSDDALVIINVSNPANPTLVQEITVGGDFDRIDGASEMLIDGDVLYIASYISSAVTIADISDPENPVVLSEIVDNSGGFNRLNTAQQLAKQGNILFVGGNEYYNGDRGFVTLVNVTNPSAPQLLSEIGHETTSFLWGGSLTTNGNLLYIAAYSDRGFSILCFD